MTDVQCHQSPSAQHWHQGQAPLKGSSAGSSQRSFSSPQQGPGCLSWTPVGTAGSGLEPNHPCSMRSPHFCHHGANWSSGAPTPSPPAHPTHPAALTKGLLPRFSQTGVQASLTANITATHTQRAPSGQPSPAQTPSESPAEPPRAGDKGRALVLPEPCDNDPPVPDSAQGQRGSAAVTISSVGSSAWLGMSPLPPDLPDPLSDQERRKNLKIPKNEKNSPSKKIPKAGTGVCDQTSHLVCPRDCPFCRADHGTTQIRGIISLEMKPLKSPVLNQRSIFFHQHQWHSLKIQPQNRHINNI